MKRIYFILFVFLAGKCFSQNLVQNWSFEDTIPCAIYTGLSPQLRPYFWFTPSAGSPDFFNTSTNCAWGGGVPQNPFGYQYPKTGNAMFGFDLYVDWGVLNNFREYIEGIFTDTLKQGHKYCVQFYVSLANNSKQAIDKIGAFISIDSTTNFGSNQPLQVIPQIENAVGNFITDTLNWVGISGEYIAQGSEKFITIGNFYDDANTDTLELSFGLPQVGAYYFIDDVSVIDCTVGIDEIKNIEDEITIFPNPFTNHITINSPVNEGNIEIINLLGEIVFQTKFFKQQTKINLSHLSQGMYFLSVKSKEKVFCKKIVKE